MKKLTALYLLLTVMVHSSLAGWTYVATFNQVVSDMKTYNNELCIIGGFTEANNQTCYWSAMWNGTSLTRHTTMIGGFGLDRLEIFNNELYATGSLNFSISSGLGRWNGSTWTGASSFNQSHTAIFADGNDLYVGSDFGTVSKRTGTGSFSALPAFVGFSPNVNAIIKFDNSIIAAGEFDSAGTSLVNNIARWDGSAWQPLGTGTDDEILSLAVRNGELYAGGRFNSAGGVAARFVAKWNGSAWSDVGGSVTDNSFYNGIRDMQVYNNELYVVGDFGEIGNVSAKYIALWNGTSWVSLNFTAGSDFLNCIEAYNGILYAATFDFDTAKVYAFNPTTAITMPENKATATLLPNPATDGIHISMNEGGNYSLHLYNSGGKILDKQEFSGSDYFHDTEVIPPGLYFVEIRNKRGILSVQKFIKQ